MKPSENAYDVAVVGYGPTGVTCANMLGARGLRVLVVERDAEIYSRARAISTDEEVIRIWQRIGLADRLKADMLPERPIAFVDANQRPFIDVVPKGHGHGHPPQSFIYQPALEQVLRDGVDRYPNVEIRLATECLRVTQDRDGAELLLAEVGGDSLTRARASWVIAADGGSSPTRGSLGIGFDGTTYEDRWVVIDTEMVSEWPGHDHLRFHCNPKRPAVDCPTPLGHHRWEFPVLDGEDEAHLVSDEGVWELLGGHNVTDEHVKILRAVVYSHHVRFASQWRRGRIFLAGDAAHVMPPWIGQGMAAGVRDADNLCWKLAGVIDGSLPESVLDSYETERQPHVRGITTRAVNVGRIICERNPLIGKARDLVFSVVNRVRPVTEWLQALMWIPEGRYAEGYLDGGKRTGAVGCKPPQPLVDTADGEQALLDDLLGSGWAIVHTGAVPPGVDDWVAAGATVLRMDPLAVAEGGVADRERTLIGWMRSRGATALVYRPDRFVYAAVGEGKPLPAAPFSVPAHA